MHWSLDQVRNMDADEYDALIVWANARAARIAERRSGDGEDSVDMDKVIDAKTAGEKRDG